MHICFNHIDPPGEQPREEAEPELASIIPSNASLGFNVQQDETNKHQHRSLLRVRSIPRDQSS